MVLEFLPHILETKLKNETRELAEEVTSTCNLFKRPHLLIKKQVVLHPDLFWYRLKGMGAKKKCTQKSSCCIFSIYILHKSKLNSLRILKYKNLFKRHKHPSPSALNIKYLGPTATTIRDFQVSLNYPIHNFKKTASLKNFWMQY